MLQHAKGSQLDCSFRTAALWEIRVDGPSTSISRRAIVLQLIEMKELKKVAAKQQAHTLLNLIDIWKVNLALNIKYFYFWKTKVLSE